MKPVYWVVAVVLGVAFAGGWTYLQTRDEDAGTVVSGEEASASPASARVVAPSEASQAADSRSDASMPDAPAPAADQIAQWISDVDSTQPAKRAAAISALAQAPRAQSLPVLRRVVLNGEPAIDRPLALKSLRELALAQGDADNGVRQAIREVIYHGDDEQFALTAQEALETVEQSEQKLAQR